MRSMVIWRCMARALPRRVLGTWLSRKRKLYHEQKLPAQLQGSDAMKMDWRTAYARRWDEQYARTKAFVDTHGHLPDETEDKTLSLWWRRQKARNQEN